MKPKLLPLIEMCVENGVRRGMQRAQKHVENPSDESIMTNIEECVISELYEWFYFDNQA